MNEKNGNHDVFSKSRTQQSIHDARSLWLTDLRGVCSFTFHGEIATAKRFNSAVKQSPTLLVRVN